jgi:uncharacterized membrane protein YcfT
MMPKPSLPVVRTPRIDTVAIFTGTLGLLAHGAMVVLDAALVATAAELLSSVDPNAQPLAGALAGVVMLHLLVLAWCGRRVVEFLDVLTDDSLPVFTRHSRARRAARRAGSTLLLSGALAPAAALLLLVLPAIGAAVGPFAGS